MNAGLRQVGTLELMRICISSLQYIAIACDVVHRYHLDIAPMVGMAGQPK